MFQKLKNLLIIATGVTLISAPILVPGMASAATPLQDQLCSGTNLDLSGKTTTGCDSSAASTSTLQGILTFAVNIFSVIVGVIAVIMLIVGGLKYITSGGDTNNVSGAKNTIVYALIGLVIVALAQFIVHFVLAKATSIGG